jgi:hypothetical protein
MIGAASERGGGAAGCTVMKCAVCGLNLGQERCSYCPACGSPVLRRRGIPRVIRILMMLAAVVILFWLCGL